MRVKVVLEPSDEGGFTVYVPALPGCISLLKLTVPAHRPVKRSTLAHLLKQARLELGKFLELL